VPVNSSSDSSAVVGGNQVEHFVAEIRRAASDVISIAVPSVAPDGCLTE